MIFWSLRLAVGPDRRVEGGRGDPLVLGEQVVGQLVEKRDPADDRRAGDELVAVGQQLLEQPDVLGVAGHAAVARGSCRRPRSTGPYFE